MQQLAATGNERSCRLKQLFCEAYNATATVQSFVNGSLASGTWPFKDTFDHKFAPLEAAAAIHDQLTAAADQPGAAVIYPEATAE